ncbi:MAG: rhodanese-like domain-containing protein [Eubacteriales bacterium]|nr:rhodanese-like domain-containing protein [Eubacteriales bacterium]
MKKKVFAVLLGTAVAASVLAGCGSSSENAQTTAAQTEAAAETAAEETSASETTEAASEAADKTTEAAEAGEVSQRTVYVTPEWVKSVLDGEQADYQDAVIAEVAYGAASDCESYQSGHIQGAQYIDICEVEDATGSEEGAYNLLPAEEVEANILSHGITKDTPVILYGGDVCGVARVAYAYIWAGVEDVKILNGGLSAWTSAGYDTETGAPEQIAAEEFGTTVPAHPEYWTSIEDAKDKLVNDDNFKLVSIRSEAEWLGETSGYSYMDKAGEPEGAVWGKGAETAFDVKGFLNDDGTVKDLAGFEEVWADCDFTLDNDLAFYCGTGWRACVPFLVLYENGYDNISVYDGGWYQWLMDDSNPVQVGDPASADCIHTTVGELPTGKAAK